MKHAVPHARRPHAHSPSRGFPARRHAALAWAVASAGLLAAASSASGQLTFVLTETGTVAPQARAGFEAAAAIWSANFTDNVTFRLTIGFAPLGSGILAQAGSTTTSPSLSTVRSALNARRTSADDDAAVASLPATATTLWMNRTDSNPNGSGSATPWLDGNNSANNTNVSVNWSVAKALGLVANSNTTSDATITFSSNFTWDFNSRDGITAGQFDFVGIAVHEIGHALGFRSGVDSLDGNPTGVVQDNFRLSSADLFRFSVDSRAQGLGVRDFTADNRAKFFSLDGGTTQIAEFARGRNFGDGQQASHWRDGLGLGVMDPTAGSGELLQISENDRRLYDVIGWTRNNTFRWRFSDGGVFSFAPNWNTLSAPLASIDALFDLSAAYTGQVTVTANGSTRDLIIRRDTLTLNLNAANRVLTVARNFIVGDGAAGTVGSLTFALGTISVTGTTTLGSATGSGTVTQTGGRLIATGAMTLGTPGGPGSIYQLIGGTLTANAGVTVRAGSILAHGGGVSTLSSLLLDGGTFAYTGGGLSNYGPITVQNGGKWTYPPGGGGGWSFASPIIVTGTGSAMDFQLANWTLFGAGTLNVNNTATFTAGLVTVNATGSPAPLQVLSGAQANLTGLLVGSNAPGAALVDGGTLAVSGAVVLGGADINAPSATGVLTVTGAAGRLTANSVTVGNGAPGQFNVSNGSVTVDNINAGGISPGTVAVTGGTITADSGIFLGNAGGTATGRVVQSAGVVNAFSVVVGSLGVGTYSFSGGTLSVDNLRVGSGPAGRGHFLLSGTGTVTASGFVSVGFGTAPGNPAADNRLDQSGGLLSTPFLGVGDPHGGTYAMTGGTLTANTLSIGAWESGSGLMSVSGGSTVNLTTLTTGSTLNSSATYAQSGGTVTVTGAATLGVLASSTNSFSVSNGRFSAASLTTGVGPVNVVHSGGTVSLTGTLTHQAGSSWTTSGGLLTAAGATLDAPTSFSGGTATFSGQVEGNSTVLVSGTARFSAPRVLLGGLSVAGGRTTLGTAGGGSVAASLALANDGAPLGLRTYLGRLEVGTSGLVVYGGISLADLVDAARSGWNNGARNGNGLAGSPVGDARDALATVAVRPAVSAFGFSDFTTFNGVGLLPSDLLVRYTYFGDTDLNGLLDARDFNAVLNGFSNSLNGWAHGDSDHDGDVDADDWSRFIFAYANQGAPFAFDPLPGGAIPEPVALGLLGAVAPLLGRRRRR